MTETSMPPAPAPAQPAVLRRGWMGVAQLVAMVAVVAGAGVAIYAERAVLRQGLGGMAHVRVSWVLAGAGAEFASMAAFGQLERVLLRATGARLALRSVLATAYNANAIAVSVPVVGSGIAATYAFREFRRGGADVGQVSIALAIAGTFSTVAFAILAAAGVAMTGNPGAAALGVAGSLVGAGLAVALVMSLRLAGFRAWLVTLTDRAMRLARRGTRGRPRRDVAALLRGTLERAGGLRLAYRALGQAFACALANWAADVGCLICALLALGIPVPWAKILVVWSAGAGAASLSPVPGGIGIVDIVLIAAFASVGIHAPVAVTVTLLYRLLSFKVGMSVVWFGYHSWLRRRAANP
jgi:putative heme transporter